MRNCCELLGSVQPHKKTLTIGIDTDITRRCIPLGINMYIGFEPRGFIAPRARCVCNKFTGAMDPTARSKRSGFVNQRKWMVQPTNNGFWLDKSNLGALLLISCLNYPKGPYQIEKEYLWFMLHPDLFRVGEGNA